MVVQNVSYSKINPDNIYGTLELRADTVVAYNTFDIISISGGDVCLLINLVDTGSSSGDNAMEWANQNRFHGTEMFPTTGGVVIKTVNTTNLWPPGLYVFDQCDFEGSGSFFNVAHHNFEATFNECYHEGTWSVGTLASGANIKMVAPQNIPTTVPWWPAGDPRFYNIGVNYPGYGFGYGSSSGS